MLTGWDVAALRFGVALEALQDGEDVFFDHLELVWDGDAVAVVVDGDDRGRLQDADGVDAIPEHAFGGGGVADGRPGDLVAVVGEWIGLRHFAIHHRRVRQPDRAGHLRARRRDIRGDVVHLSLVAPRAVGVDEARAVVTVHRASARDGLGFEVGVGVELGEPLLDVDHAEHEHPGLVAVVARAPVAFTEGARNGEVGEFLAVAKDAKLGLAAEDFAASDEGGLAGGIGEAVVFENIGGLEGKVKRALFIGNEESLLNWIG